MNTQFREQLRDELDKLRASGARRQELSRHACKRLFFDQGVRPSVTLVREFTQTGSASDIPKDIELFWDELRATLRVRIDAGAVPEALQNRAGDLLASLFAEAHLLARSELEAERARIEANAQSLQTQVRDAEIRRETFELAHQRAEARLESGSARIAALEAELNALKSQGIDAHGSLREAIARLEKENGALSDQLQGEQAASVRLRDRIDDLQAELRQNTEHYAQQIKDAVKEAERHVKPMLVELDSLRGMAATYQSGVREAGQKEFDFIQQLSAARGRADRLEAQVRTQSDEIDALVHERDAHRMRASVSNEIGGLLALLAADGRLDAHEIAALGTQIDAYITPPSTCPACESGEPELQRHEDEFELLCPNCDRTSGAVSSKLAAVDGFRRSDEN
ncbi:Chromosome segregation ATPase [Candidatus Burkholderia verschuerenii]|uniref:Chromosome segregation ATPase n=1 Tax=Candidatus Burkholderia verschuerenii TaxID=242163 RepID=A0A0L0MIA4_9BURK|nr:DNA-binding protein [Candidatus Burkholderia verschuerenii]KND61694.1 Chromosome segregation ATPase [Candidatus Burkholderia verschuerenii]